MITMPARQPSTRPVCADCSLLGGCLPMGLSPAEQRQLDGLISPPHRLRRGGALFRAGGALQSVAVVRKGTLKSAVLDESGREQIVGFHLTGELLGLDGIADSHHSRDVVALEDSEICRIAYPELQKLSSEIPALGHHLHTAMSREISRGYGVMLLLGSMRAEKRLAFFLLDLSRRAAARDGSPARLLLHMTRKEIGGYLGLKLESVSRLFTTFRRDGLIEVRGKAIHILDAARLQALVRDAHPRLGALFENGDTTVLNRKIIPLRNR